MGGLCWGDLPRACPAPRPGPKPASRGSEQSHLLGAIPLFFHPERGPPFRMEEQGDLRSGGDGTEGSAALPPRRPVARTPAPCVRAPWRQRAAYRGMQVSCGGQGTAWALSGRQRGPGPRESPQENPQAWPQWLQGLPKAPAMGPGPAHLGPGLPQVNAFGGRQGREAAYAFTERGLELWGTEVAGVTVPSRVV